MSYKAHIASQYQVEYNGAEYRFDEFIKLYNRLLDAADELGIEDISNHDDDDSWYEFDRAALSQLKNKLDETCKGKRALRKFINTLLTDSDQRNDFIRVDVWE